MDTPAGVDVQDTDKEEEEADLQIGMMNSEDEDEEEEDKEKVLAVDGVVLRDDFTPGAEGEVPLASYVRAYQEMNKFIKLLGPLFYFVAYDVKRKVTYSLQRYQYSYKLMDVIRKEMAGKNGRYYVDVKTMINYEKENDLVYRSSPMSGTDAFLKLNRVLELAIGIMKEIMEDEEEPTLGQVASEVYLTTTAKFHPSILSTMLSGVLLLMPSRATVRNRITRGTDEGEALMRRLMPEVMRSVKQTYEACLALYREHDLHNLNVRGRTDTTP
ncbi:Ceramide-1-phosphate transfer protein [Chionoecetes opilio]|uniref:Ceramide-1-phosphate transfer protein n=1 Tax=Chionoecetes opilio TaxID=41210 RepID=A0A8J4YKN9_CHIOP|nr:Ceramide-1-phosphate transfer protein [Chionoecetes opilio]